MTETAQVKKVRLEELLPIIREKMDAGGQVTIPVTGTSMKPTLVAGRDSVTLTRLEGSPKRLDLPLYRRRNGQFVLHRIVSLEPDGSFTCCGDHQWVREPGLRPEQIVGMVCQIERQGRAVSVQAPGHRLWVRLWVGLLPCRRLLFRLSHGPAWLRKKIKKER
ncbi:MAG: S24/S26 family peptidase [Oscillospiraceae bacterium]|nr:S24/S26 family peptidase [Oscillospiraceae bacterium]